VLQWTGPGNFTSDQAALSGLIAGDYLLTVTDQNGCSTTLPITLLAPTPLEAQLVPSVQPGGANISCAGGSNGTIQAQVSGGVPGMSYLWNGPNGFTSNAADLADLGAGTYCLTVTDTNGCSVQQCITLTAPDSLTAVAVSSAADCGQSTGAASATVSGGSAPYTYLWSTGETIADLTGIGTGNYVVTVTDVNGCTAQASAIISGSPAVQGSAAVSNALCNGNADGVIDLTMTTGTAPFGFVWTGGITSEDIAGLIAGAYQVQVIDAAGCTWSAIYTVDEPPVIGADSSVLIHPNGFNISAMGATDGSISVDANGGTAPYSYLWSNGATSATINGLAAGSYTVTITDANGCVQQLTFTLDQPNVVQLPTGFTPNGDGYNDLFVVRGIEGHPDNQLLVFNRWGNVVYDQLNYRNTWGGENLQGELLPNGTYFVILRLGSDAANLQGYVDLRR
jgi:gliding motility-associated-like protein